jgi:hypothetical protein
MRKPLVVVGAVLVSILPLLLGFLLFFGCASEPAYKPVDLHASKLCAPQSVVPADNPDALRWAKEVESNLKQWRAENPLSPACQSVESESTMTPVEIYANKANERRCNKDLLEQWKAEHQDELLPNKVYFVMMRPDCLQGRTPEQGCEFAVTGVPWPFGVASGEEGKMRIEACEKQWKNVSAQDSEDSEERVACLEKKSGESDAAYMERCSNP